MKLVRYFWTQNGRIYPIELDSELVQHVRWNRAETLKVEVWPFDLKAGPSTQIPYGKHRETKRDSVREIRAILAENRRKKEEEPNQIPLIRLNETRTPYTEEFTKRDDARNRAYLSPKVPKRWKSGKRSPPQIDAPF